MKINFFRVFIACLFLGASLVYADINTGLVGWYKLNETSGNAVDSSNSANTGTVSGTTIVSNCKKGGCRNFNGSGDYIDLGTPTALNLPGEMSVFAWINSNNVASQLWPVAQASVGSSSKQFCLETNGNKVVARWAGGPRSTSVSSISTGRWNHIGWTREGVSGNWTVKIYINGVLDQTTTSIAGDPGTQYTTAIGRLGATSAGYHNGLIDDVRIYNRVLTAQEANDLYIPGAVMRGGVISNVKINQQ